MLLPVAAASGWMSARMSRKRAPRNNGFGSEEAGRAYTNQCIQGLNYLLSEQSDKAIQLLVEMVDVDEDTVETHLVLGSLFRRRGEVDRAIRIHQNVIARPTLSAVQRQSAMLQLGVDYLKAGLLDRAENILLQLVEVDPDNPDVYRYLRNLYEQEKEWQSAIRMARSLQRVGKAPQYVRIAHYLCEQVENHVRASRVDQATETVKKALATDPDCIRAYIQAGDIHAAQGKTRAAIKYFRQALKKNRNFSPIILKHLHALFSREGLLSQLPAFIDQHADCRKDAAARYFLIKTYLALGEHQRVEEMLHEELSRKEASPYIIKAYLEKMRDSTEGEIRESFSALGRLLDARLSSQMACHCTQCGFQSNVVFWQCPGCQNWGSVRPHQNPLEYSWLEN